MISRASAIAIANAYTGVFTGISRGSYGRSSTTVYRDSVYDFLFENEYEAWFCNIAKKPTTPRDFKEFWMRLHTGESIFESTKSWDNEQRRKLGQRLLENLAGDILKKLDKFQRSPIIGETYEKKMRVLQSQLELDGYIFRDGELLHPAADILNVEAERSVIHGLYTRAHLERRDDAFDFLRLGEEHFLAERWADSIANVRKFFELTLQEGARVLSTRPKSAPSKEIQFSRPVEVRTYLEQAGLIERKERELVDKLYGLLSETGAHPYMAESDQARLLRQLALTMSQFFLLRLGSALSSNAA